ncbi:MAG: T9SS type A sorting domain-containing protein [bacterium]
MKKILTASTVLLLLFSSYLTRATAGDRGAEGRKQHIVKSALIEPRVPARAHQLAKSPRQSNSTLSRDEAIFTENFDAGAPGWTYQDLWNESFWHVSTTGAFAGNSYWCANASLGGYDDFWTQGLTTPAIVLPAGSSPTLTFMHNYSTETPGGEPAGFNAWDVVNVRVSVAGGDFEVVTPGGGYPYSSAFSGLFRYGINTPGWGGKSNGYIQSTFDLSAFAGQTVRIRFELLSDQFFSHGDDPTLFGWRIDNIVVAAGGNTIFSDNAGDTGTAQLVAAGPGGNTIWNVTNAAAASAPNSAGFLDPASGNYDHTSKGALVSPAIALDNLPANSRQLVLDFQIQGSLDPALDASGNTQDEFSIEFRAYSNGGWSYWGMVGPNGNSIITGLPPNFVHIAPALPDFTDFSFLVGTADSVQYRLVGFTLPDGAVTAPANIFIDDFVLTAVTTLANDVTLFDLDIPFPNITAFDVQRAAALVQNIGLNSQPTVITRYRVNDGPVTLPIPPAPVNVTAGAQAFSNFNWRLPAGSAPGDYKLTTLTTLGTDENRTNDSLSVEPITLYPEGLAELGYDDRFNQDQFLAGLPSLVNFSVLADLRGLTDTYNLNQVKVDLINLSETDDQLRIVVGTAIDDTTIGEVLLETIEPVPAGDFSSHFFDVNAFGLTAERIIVLVDNSVSNGNAAGVADIGGTGSGSPFANGHNFRFLQGRWIRPAAARQIRALVSWLAAADIVSVRDVRNDNGKQVHVTWFPSPNESFGEISFYVLWRAVKGSQANGAASGRSVEVPNLQALYDYGIQKGKSGDRVSVAGASTWDFITLVPSHPGFTAYGYVAPTLADSNASGRNHSTFMVTAYDLIGGFVDSEVDSGYSVDNIAPSVPGSFTAAVVPSGQSVAVQLTWKAVEDEDLAYYAIYKNDSTTPLARTIDLAFTDPNVTAGTTVKYSLTAFDVNGNQGASANATVNVTSVEERPGNAIPVAYALDNNYPNPFNPQTTIDFALPERAHVKLVILNSVGQEIETLVEREMQPGYHQAVWNANRYTSGVYFYRLTANNFSQLKKMVLAK